MYTFMIVEMSAWGRVVDTAEVVKWQDALEVLTDEWDGGLEAARKCRWSRCSQQEEKLIERA
jgi:hypothetical protein